MKRVDSLIIRELLGPWLFGVGLFTALLFAATYLGRIAGFVLDGVPPAVLLQLVFLMLPAMFTKTFSMSVLLAALLAFGRLSSDSEIVALRASGASIFRIVRPVMYFSIIIAAVTFAFNETVVPGATAKSLEITRELVRTSRVNFNHPIARTFISNQKLRLGIVARNVNPASYALQGVTVVAYDENEQEAFVMFAKELRFEGEDDWRVEGGGSIFFPDGKLAMKFDDSIWPEQIPRITTNFAELIREKDDDFDAQSMQQLRRNIQRHKERGDLKPSNLANYEYGYWNKISVPLAAFIFGTLGAVLGIRNHRTGTAAGFALAIAIIFGYVTLANFMNVWAMGGLIPPWVASFMPIVIGLITSGVIMWRRNA